MMKNEVSFIFLSLLLIGFSGCITPAKQTDTLLAAPPLALPDFHEIHDIKFIDEGAAFCGPSTLAMAMNWAGDDAKIEEVIQQVYTSGMPGSFQEDLISTSRRHGLMAVPVRGLSALLTEVSENHPVIVFENLSVSWLPRWHYSLIVGYDLKNEEIIMHSGPKSFEHWDLRKFERSWLLGEYWGLVVLPSGTLASTADEATSLQATVGIEQADRSTDAEKSYRKILERWPTSLIAMIGLADLAYQQGRSEEAVQILRVAVKTHPESEEAKYNLQLAETLR